MPSQIRIFVSLHTDFSLFRVNTNFLRVLSANFEVNSDFDILNSIPILSSKEQAILIACRCQYFISGVTTLVNRKGAKSES